MGGTLSSNSWQPPQELDGIVALVTGANSGIGYETALGLAQKGASVTLACRDKQRGEEALRSLVDACPECKFHLRTLDVSSFADIERFVKDFKRDNAKLDILVNNAGIMMPPTRELSKDGFEMQLATNHLGPFLLTGKLLPLLNASVSPRVVAVSSLLAWKGKAYDTIEFHRDYDYNPQQVYADSKLDNLLFMRELGKRYPHLTSVAAHPGGTSTNLQKHKYGSFKFLMQSARNGARPSLRAAMDPLAPQGVYYGPYFCMFGPPSEAYFPGIAKDTMYARRMWDASSRATGMKF